jgi:surfactin synthase thioesterase subunit
VGGHCYGGILAFEVARRLQASGAAVGAVVFMEVPTPGYPKVLRHWRDYARQFWSAFGKVDRAAIVKAGAHAKLLGGIFRGRMRRAGVGSAPQKEHPNTAAGRVYRPVPLACDVVHMIARDEPHSTLILDDPRLGWKEFTRGKFTLVRTPGMGRTFFLEPSVKELAAELRMVLDAAAKRPAESLRLRDRQPV